MQSAAGPSSGGEDMGGPTDHKAGPVSPLVRDTQERL